MKLFFREIIFKVVVQNPGSSVYACTQLFNSC